MKYASQINILLLVVAVVTFGYAITETLLRSPVVPVLEVQASDPAGAADRTDVETPEAGGSQSVRETPRLPSQRRRPVANQVRPSIMPAGTISAPAVGTGSRRTPQPVWNAAAAAAAEEGGARVISTGSPASREESPSTVQTGPSATESTGSAPRRPSRAQRPAAPPERARFARPGSTSEQDSESGDSRMRRQAPPPPPARSSNR